MKRDIIFGACVVSAVVVFATVLLVRDVRRISVASREIAPNPPAIIIEAPAPVAPPPGPAPLLPPPPVTVAPPRATSAPAAQAWNGAPQGRRGPNPAPAAPITVPVARQALAGVGADPAADEVYIAAINDTNLPPNERKNLIEDLNETGFADPRNLTRADLPMIEYRLAMIEELGPVAMDDTNAAAFQEAYKDLTNMHNRLTGQ